MRKALRGLAVFTCVIAGACLFHAYWLPLLTIPLSQFDEEELSQKSDRVTNLLMTQAAWRVLPVYDFARDFAQQSPENRILILDSYESPTESVSSIPTFVEDVTQRLKNKGVHETQIEIVGDGTAYNDLDKMLAAANWLDENPGQSLIIPTSRLAGGILNMAADETLSAEQRLRTYVLGFRYRGIDENNWWKTSTGLKSLIAEYLTQLCFRLAGSTPINANHWNPDEYERWLSTLPDANPRHALIDDTTETMP